MNSTLTSLDSLAIRRAVIRSGRAFDKVSAGQPRCAATVLKRSSKDNELFGGARRNRTDDLFNAIEALSQLSYGPTLSPAWVSGVHRDSRRGDRRSIMERARRGKSGVSPPALPLAARRLPAGKRGRWRLGPALARDAAKV
jgi:hypothetical protein